MDSLQLQQIQWNTSSAEFLEKIMKYEAVHQITSWDALKQRLGPGRLCFAFTHPGIPFEPLTFIQIALTHSISDNVQSILQQKPDSMAKELPTVAIFYSITSPHVGLSGIDLGVFLIKRVVKQLQEQIPSISTFCTLSPIPKFRIWLETVMELNDSPLLTQAEESQLRSIIYSDTKNGHLLKLSLSQFDKLQPILKPILLRLCHRYIVDEKRRNYALDPVTHFHIRNGASLYRINWMGDSSVKGTQQSYGMMANYIYVLDEIEENNAKYLLDGHVKVVKKGN